MKRIMILAILSLSLSGIAQERRENNRKEKVEFTPEQRTELQVKKMTLELDLSAKQQKEISELMKKQQVKRAVTRDEMKAKREEMKKRNSDDKFAMRTKMLDERIAMHTEMKKVLTPEQFAKWEKNADKKTKHVKMRKNKKESKQK